MIEKNLPADIDINPMSLLSQLQAERTSDPDGNAKEYQVEPIRYAQNILKRLAGTCIDQDYYPEIASNEPIGLQTWVKRAKSVHGSALLSTRISTDEHCMKAGYFVVNRKKWKILSREEIHVPALNTVGAFKNEAERMATVFDVGDLAMMGSMLDKSDKMLRDSPESNEFILPRVDADVVFALGINLSPAPNFDSLTETSPDIYESEELGQVLRQFSSEVNVGKRHFSDDCIDESEDEASYYIEYETKDEETEKLGVTYLIKITASKRPRKEIEGIKKLGVIRITYTKDALECAEYDLDDINSNVHGDELAKDVFGISRAIDNGSPKEKLMYKVLFSDSSRTDR